MAFFRRPTVRLWPVLVATAAVLFWGCDTRKARTSPRAAFSRLAACLEQGSAVQLFGELDRDSRWSAHSIHRTLSQTRSVLNTAFPKTQHQSALGRWYAMSQAPDGARLFEIYCRQRHCLKKLARGFGAVVAVTDESADRVIVETTRNAQFPMAAADGEWGLALYRDELQTMKIRVLDRLSQVRKNAKDFDSLQRATTRPKTGAVNADATGPQPDPSIPKEELNK